MEQLLLHYVDKCYHLREGKHRSGKLLEVWRSPPRRRIPSLDGGEPRRSSTVVVAKLHIIET